MQYVLVPSSAPAAMEIGTVVTYGGRSWYVRGLDPYGVTPQYVYLENVDSGRRLTVDVRKLETSRRHLWAVDSEPSEQD